MYGKNIKAFNNNVYSNNLKNFAPPGNIVGFVPPGTGFLILATRDVEIYDKLGGKLGFFIFDFWGNNEKLSINGISEISQQYPVSSNLIITYHNKT